MIVNRRLDEAIIVVCPLGEATAVVRRMDQAMIVVCWLGNAGWRGLCVGVSKLNVVCTFVKTISCLTTCLHVRTQLRVFIRSI